MAAVAGLVAHGGTAGAIVEVALIVGAVAVFALVYLGKHRARDEEPEDNW